MISLPSDTVFSSLKMDSVFIHSGLQCETATFEGNPLHLASWARTGTKQDISQPLAYTWNIYVSVRDDPGF